MKGYNFTINVTKQRTIIVEAEDDVHAIEKVANRLDKIMVEEENVTGADIDDFKFIKNQSQKGEKVKYNVNISQMSYAIIEVDADSKEEAESMVKDMSHSDIDNDAQHRSTSDFIEIIEVDEVDTDEADAALQESKEVLS